MPVSCSTCEPNSAIHLAGTFVDLGRLYLSLRVLRKLFFLMLNSKSNHSGRSGTTRELYA